MHNSTLTLFKILLLFFIALNSQYINSKPSLDLANELNASEILNTLDSIKTSNGLYTPIAVRYMKKGDQAPSCVLIDAVDKSNVIELISPEERGAFGNCAHPISKPVSFTNGKVQFATFKYVVEDPRSEFTTMYQLVKLSSTGMSSCKNDASISEQIQKSAKKLGVLKASKRAVDKLGCEG